ncbi:hypothetical protein PHYBOEH_011384 [Phytophthora boehmeriae]|uniref:Uncharacterized protein n=1 Tax=Phytophthora boehmeriae TaxID=109152 RepID=A0A8T1X3Q9_9STRA|nr:hypothetical protein PHYBOEH_011384 [Phytophthora boehmeriae]
MSDKTQRLKPSEVLTAFSAAKARATKHAASRILELANTEDHTAQVSSTVPLHQPLFEPTPAEVWIEEYTPFQTLNIKLRFRNCDTVVRRLKIEPPRSPVFTLKKSQTMRSISCAVRNANAFYFLFVCVGVLQH